MLVRMDKESRKNNLFWHKCDICGKELLCGSQRIKCDCERLNKVCKKCGKTFYHHSGETVEHFIHNRQYCSMACKSGDIKYPETKKCIRCGAEYHKKNTNISKKEWNKRKFCSKRCANGYKRTKEGQEYDKLDGVPRIEALKNIPNNGKFEKYHKLDMRECCANCNIYDTCKVANIESMKESFDIFSFKCENFNWCEVN